MSGWHYIAHPLTENWLSSRQYKRALAAYKVFEAYADKKAYITLLFTLG